MNRWILNDLPWHVDLDDAMKRLRIPEDDADDFVSMVPHNRAEDSSRILFWP